MPAAATPWTNVRRLIPALGSSPISRLASYGPDAGRRTALTIASAVMPNRALRS